MILKSIKKLNPFLLASAILLTVPGLASAINNPPHDASNSINCDACHLTFSEEASSPVWNFTPDLVDPDNNQINNRICWQCHKDGGLGKKKTHSRYASETDKFGIWAWVCTTCHDPHQQKQTNNLALVPTLKGTVTVVNGPGKIFTLSLSLPDRTGDADPAGDYVGWTIVPNTLYKTINYKITANTATTVTVKGTVQTTRVIAGTSQFVIIPGRLLKDIIATPGGNKTVRLLQLEGAYSFVHNDGLAAGGNDSTPDGVCQVCHGTRLESWATIKHARADGTGFSGDIHPTTTSANCTVSCHSHANKGFGPVCDACHGFPPIAATLGGPNGLVNSEGGTGSLTPGAHEKHAVTLGYVCATCHTGGMPASPIYDKKIQIGFSIAGGAYQSGSYDGRTLLANGYTYARGNNWTTVTAGGTKVCSNVYCHGATLAPDGGTNTTPTWDNAASGQCGTCHGVNIVTNTPTRGAHLYLHVGYGILDDETDGPKYPCSLCHKDPSTDKSLHVNGLSEVIFSSDDPRVIGAQYSGTPAVLDAYGVCTNVYCHSNVQTSPPGGTLTYRSPNWGSTVVYRCNNCHFGSVNMAQTVQLIGLTGPYTGSHATHFSYNFGCIHCHAYNPEFSGIYYDCSACHYYGVGRSARSEHANYAVNINISKYWGTGTAYSGTPHPGDAYGNCANTYCHSNGTSVASGLIPLNTSVDWGSGPLLACDACHGYPPAYINGSPKATSHWSTSHSGLDCSTCHWKTTSTGNTITWKTIHVNRVYDVDPATWTSFTYSYSTTGGTCSSVSCHGGGATKKWGGP